MVGRSNERALPPSSTLAFISFGRRKYTGRQHIWTDLRWACENDGQPHELLTTPEALGQTRYTAAFEHFFSCLQEGKSPETSIYDGVLNVKMAEAVYQSIRSGNTIDL